MESPWVKARGLFLLLVDQSQRDRRPSLWALIMKKLDKGPKDSYNICASSSKTASSFGFGREPSVGNELSLKLILGFRRR
jgi:hypothetical protein